MREFDTSLLTTEYNLVSRPHLVCVRISLCAILKAIHTGVGLGSGTETRVGFGSRTKTRVGLGSGTETTPSIT